MNVSVQVCLFYGHGWGMSCICDLSPSLCISTCSKWQASTCTSPETERCSSPHYRLDHQPATPHIPTILSWLQSLRSSLQISSCSLWTAPWRQKIQGTLAANWKRTPGFICPHYGVMPAAPPNGDGTYANRRSSASIATSPPQTLAMPTKASVYIVVSTLGVGYVR